MMLQEDSRWEKVPEGIRNHLHKRSHQYQERILREYAPELSPPLEPPQPKKPSRRGENLKGGYRPTRFDYQKIADLWSSGLTVKKVAEEVGCSQNTVKVALAKIRPPGYELRPGPRRQEVCSKGHDMKVYGRPAGKGGGRYCAACRSIREKGRIR